MPLFTSYLGFFNRLDFPVWFYRTGLKQLTRIYVMRKRGNDVVAPSEKLLEDWKSGRISWEEYRHRYLDHIGHRQAVIWMKQIGLAQKENVVLICYERDAAHCHRVLLAQSISKWSGIEYKGELSNFMEVADRTDQVLERSDR